MAKAGFWLQGATGKLAGSALQKGANGETIIRDNSKKPRNPKTAAQTLQRVIFNSVSQAYTALQPIVSHSFQGKVTKSENATEFRRRNLNYFRQRAAEVGDQLSSFVNFSPIGEQGVRAARFIISNGSLPTVPLEITPDQFLASLSLNANSYESVISTYGLRRGDQLTLVSIEKSAIDNRQYPHYCRIILDPRNEDGTAASLSSAFVTEDGVNLPNERNEGNFETLAYQDGALLFRLSNGIVCACGAIVSREDSNGVWMRSFCQMILNEAAIAADAITLTEAIALSRNKGVIYYDDDDKEYLNNAGTGGSQSTNSGSTDSSTPGVAAYANNTVEFTASGNTIRNSVSGGNVTLTAPVTRATISGSGLDTLSLKAGNTNNEADATALTLGGGNTTASWSGNLAAGSMLYVFKGGTLWFRVTALSSNVDEDQP